MNCMKCGAKIEHDQVFCPKCLAEMEKYPVKPDVVVTLPKRSAARAQQSSNHRRYSDTQSVPEQKYRRLKRRCTGLKITCILSVLAALCSTFALSVVMGKWERFHKRGQNYTTVTETQTPASELPTYLIEEVTTPPSEG